MEYGSEKMAEEERNASAEKLKEKANNYFKGTNGTRTHCK